MRAIGPGRDGLVRSEERPVEIEGENHGIDNFRIVNCLFEPTNAKVPSQLWKGTARLRGQDRSTATATSAPRAVVAGTARAAGSRITGIAVGDAPAIEVVG